MTLLDLHRMTDSRFFRSILIEEREGKGCLRIERGKLVPRQAKRRPGRWRDVDDIGAVFCHFEQREHAAASKGDDGGTVKIAQPAIALFVTQHLQADAFR